MGCNRGGKRQKKSSFELISFFKSRRPRREDDMWEDYNMSARRVWPSDEDRHGWVAEPHIDRNATAFIQEYLSCIVLECECQTLTANPAGKS
ncbi:hypothetical protein ACE6H2_011942 [Prunus campanulata]